MIYERVLDTLQTLLLNFDDPNVSEDNDNNVKTLPVFSKTELLDVCENSQKIFLNEPTVLDLQGDFIVLGDIHGNLFDIIRIFRIYGLPPTQKYLFLGDLIDRGSFSLLVVTLIFTLKIKYPDSIYSIRGNHEFKEVCSTSGFFDEIKELYTKEETANSIFRSFISVFDCLPLAAIINQSYFCVHGGVGPKFHEISQLANIARPLDELYGGIAVEILWSDPSDEVEKFKNSDRGAGYKFGLEAIRTFLTTNKFKLLIRSHQYVEKGYQYSLDNVVLTVFSSSNYCGDSNNTNGAVIIKEGNEKEEPTVVGPPIPWITRQDVKLYLSPDRNAETTKVEVHKCKRQRRVSATPPLRSGFPSSYKNHHKNFSHIKLNRFDQSTSNQISTVARKSMPTIAVKQSNESTYNDYSSDLCNENNEDNSKASEIDDQNEPKSDSSYSNDQQENDDDGILIEEGYLHKMKTKKGNKRSIKDGNNKQYGSLHYKFRHGSFHQRGITTPRNQDGSVFQIRFKQSVSDVKKE